MVKKTGLKISGDLEKLAKSKANEILKKGISKNCPSCSKSIVLTPGKNKCKYCGAEINFSGKF